MMWLHIVGFLVMRRSCDFIFGSVVFRDILFGSRYGDFSAGSKSDLDFLVGLLLLAFSIIMIIIRRTQHIESAPWIVNRVAYRIPWAAFAGDCLWGDMQIAFNNNGVVHNSILLNLPSCLVDRVPQFDSRNPKSESMATEMNHFTHNSTANTNICYYLSLLCHANG